MKYRPLALIVIFRFLFPMYSAMSQTFVPDNTVMQKIWAEGIEKSHIYPLAQTLLDSIGPRLTGSPEQQQANDWLVGQYHKWGITARAERYGTWIAWHRGAIHIDLRAPRIRSLEGMLMTWSPGTRGPIEGPVVIFPALNTEADFKSWLQKVRGKFVLLSFPEPTCRPDENWKAFATPESFEQMQRTRAAARDSFYTTRRKSGIRGADLFQRLEDGGALGVVVELLSPPHWLQGWGVSRIGSATARKIPELGLSCEDYGLVYRLAENNQGPILRLDAEAESLGEVPVSNVIAELKGTEKPDEYVMLSAHLDSWDAASGATDNGATSVAIMEAMRILKVVAPNPKRTILAGHWNGEEQGFNGSRAFSADHPEIVNGIQAIFDHDNGTGRVAKVSMQGFTGTGAFLRDWLSHMPKEITRQISLIDPGTPDQGIDAASFTCSGAPAFSLSSINWDYEAYTWHTNRDTFDKLALDDLKINATLFAMLAYMASETAVHLPREGRITNTDARTGRSIPWPKCRPAMRSSLQGN